jgi:hypothetical protein
MGDAENFVGEPYGIPQERSFVFVVTAFDL